MRRSVVFFFAIGFLTAFPLIAEDAVSLTREPIQINAAVNVWVNDSGTIVVEVDRHNPLARRGDGVVDEVYFLQRDKVNLPDGLDERLRMTLPDVHITVSSDHFVLSTPDGQFALEAGLDTVAPEEMVWAGKGPGAVRPLHVIEPKVVGIGRGTPEYVQVLSQQSCAGAPCDSGGPGSSQCQVAGCFCNPTQCGVTCQTGYFACCLCEGGGLGKACCGCRKNSPE